MSSTKSYTLSPLLIKEPGWVYEPKDNAPNPTDPQQISLIENSTYSSIFYGRDHDNFLCEESHKGPMIASILREEDPDTIQSVFQILLWTVAGQQLHAVPTQNVQTALWKCGKITVNDILKCFDEDLESSEWFSVLDEDFSEVLRDRQRRINAATFKWGVLYCAQGQNNERQMFGNPTGSADYEHFLSTVAKKIPLKAWPRYSGRLDTEENLSGTYSYFSDWQNLEIMWHVSTLLPHKPKDPQHIQKKRHIGNDLVCIVYMDGTQSYNPKTIKTRQIHVYIVVQKLWPPGPNTARVLTSTSTKSSSSFLPLTTPEPGMASSSYVAPTSPPNIDGFQLEAGKTYYRVEVCSREGVPAFAPALPSPPIFEEGEGLQNWILAKCVNAERSTYKSPSFKKKMKYSREVSLKRICEKYLYDMEDDEIL